MRHANKTCHTFSPYLQILCYTKKMDNIQYLYLRWIPCCLSLNMKIKSLFKEAGWSTKYTSDPQNFVNEVLKS